MFQAYIIKCLVNRKAYIGITSRKLRQRWNEHLHDAKNPCIMVISRAIAKHGASNFRIRLLAKSDSWAAICAIEKELIVRHGTKSPQGYNISDGGEGPFGIKRSPESVEKSAAKHRGRPCHPNTRQAAHEYHLGRKKSAIHRARIAAAKIGVPRSEEMKSKLRASWAEKRARGDFKTLTPYAHARKRASAEIAKIPPALASWIARIFKPNETIALTPPATE